MFAYSIHENLYAQIKKLLCHKCSIVHMLPKSHSIVINFTLIFVVLITLEPEIVGKGRGIIA